ncbi:unnamed protein product (macronuclear) [Paramecium tetraurelia]|uniref:Protein kinase domain-containing protein n=1 Tax=Paramecium tetraurelia TaxID=5888 RepID=A0BDN1_PARTE|nr:uncharacterized protein GSPATT00027677001 [Paramecium tetraurelia]CAK56648.1 unnamed protein product [Paramecium tetraurelia]|eukprot:XP_001424046.1 hypothetical protein (macronuclear) [Paramecium tetraurelia strain d4-2]
MSEEIQQSNSGQQLITNYFNQNPENSMDRLKQMKKRKIENEISKKKMNTKSKSDEESSNDNFPQAPVNLPNCQKIYKYLKNPKEICNEAGNVGKTQMQKSLEESKQKMSTNDITNYMKSKEVKIVQQPIQKPQDEEANKLQQKLLEKEQIEKQLRQEKQQLESERQELILQHNAFKKRTQDVFAEALKQVEELKREKMREYLERERYRLGEFVSSRNNVRFVEEWQDGYEIKQVKESLQKLENERTSLEQQKNEIKDKQSTKNQKDKQNKLFELDFVNGDLDANQKKLRIQFQLSILKKEEEELKLKLTKLEEEKQQLAYKTRRFMEEQKADPRWPLIAQRYQTLGLLGKGGFSEVYKAFDLQEYRLCACKIHYLNPQWNENAKNNYIKHALRENDIHKRLKHVNIVSLYDTQEIDQDSFCTVLEYCDGTDLNQHLKKYKIIAEKEAKLILRQVLAALHHMSCSLTKIIHYDLKPQNILFHKGEVKLTDFGLCKVLDQDTTRQELTSQGLGTYWYLPPECFMEQPNIQISTKVDVWSIGVILFEMVFGRKPFGEGMSQERIAQERVILNSFQVKFPQKPNVSQDCKDFILKCLTYNMEARWNITEAFYCNYIQS